MFDASGLDRLLPRHDAHAALELDWDIRPVRRVLNRGKTASVSATVHDLSLEGALVHVLSSSEQAVGADVSIRVFGVDGHAVVRHRRKAPASDGVLYGIQFRGGPEFKRAISDAVTAFRENDGRLRAHWEHSR